MLVDEWIPMPTPLTTGGYAGTSRCEDSGLLCSYKDCLGATSGGGALGVCSRCHDRTAHPTRTSKLGYSLGMDIVQRVLPLHISWPCRRTRWWCTLLPKAFQIYDFGPMPVFEKFQTVQSIFGKWPIWPEDVEHALELSDEELRIYLDPAFGTDQRRLQMNGTASCILHSYGSVLKECPCACRGKFSLHRLQRDGVRGFFVQGKNKERYLHVAEAAFL